MMRACTHLCGLWSQLVTWRTSVWEVLQGISWATVPVGLGGSATPKRLCRMPVPSGRGKKMDPYNREGHTRPWYCRTQPHP